MRAAWWWIDRWRKSTAYTDMTLAEQGAYRNLLDELWLRHGFLPNDERILAKIAGDSSEWPRVRSAVLSRFVLTTSGWRNLTHDEVSAQSQRRKDKQQRYRLRHAGNAAGNENGNGYGNRGGSPSPSPSPSLDPLEIPITSGNGTSALTPLPPLLRKGGRRRKRLTKEEITNAARIRRLGMMPCQHEPKCPNYHACVEQIAYEIRERRATK